MIAESFDVQRDEAMKQFLRGEYRWQATLETAIAELDIPDGEVEALRERRKKRLKEVEAMLGAESATERAPSAATPAGASDRT